MTDASDVTVGQVYLLTNIVTGKFYVGLTTRSPDARWEEHQAAAKGGSPLLLHRAIRKHGAGAFTVQCLETVQGTREALVAAEIRHIASRASLSPNGYNLTKGGDGVDYAVPEVRERQLQGVHNRSSNPVWQQHVAEAAKRRAEDPHWRASIVEAGHRRSADPEWRRQNAEFLQKLHADPLWHEAVTAGARKRSDDPEWRKHVASGAKKRALDPVCQANLREGCRKRSADPEYKAALARGIQKRSVDPAYHQAMLQGAQKRINDPNWQTLTRETHRRQRADPSWQQANAEGLRKAWVNHAAKAVERDAHLPPHEQARRAKRREADRKYKAEQRARSKALET